MKLIDVKEVCISQITYKKYNVSKTIRKLYKKTSCSKILICAK